MVSAAERDIVKTVELPPGGMLKVETYRGAISVSEADANDVRIAIHLEIGAKDEAGAERLAASLKIETETTPSGAILRVRRPGESRAHFDWSDEKQIEPTLRLTVPRRCSLDLRTILGSIVVGRIEGTIVARTEKGDVFLRQVTGSADVATEFGDVVVSRCEGAVTARVLQGTVRLGTVTGRCDVRNSSGDVEVLAAKSEVRAYAEAGSAIIGFPRDFVGPAEIQTSGGNIIARIDPAANCEVHATSSLLARVEARLPVSVQSGRIGSRKLVARLNSGGAQLVLRASGGGVRIDPGETPFE